MYFDIMRANCTSTPGLADLLNTSWSAIKLWSNTTTNLVRVTRCLSSLNHTLPPHGGANCAFFHSSTIHLNYRNTDFEDEPMKQIGRAKLVAPNFLKYNDIVYPPTEPGLQERPAEICHARMQIKYGTKKMWFIAAMIRGMSVDEAIKQLSFHKRKGAAHIKEVLEEAQEMAVKEHNVEFRSNLWVCDSFVNRGIIVKGFRKHGRPRYGIVQYRYTNYFVRLREGRPPKHYYPPGKTGYEKMEEYIKDQRARKLILDL